MPQISPALQKVINTSSLDRVQSDVFDAVVVGAGAAGGYAAMKLTAAGLKTLVLDAGVKPTLSSRPWTGAISSVVERIATPELFEALPPAISNLGRKGLRLFGKVRQPMQSKCFAWEMAPAQFVDDRDNPYATSVGSEFTWFRTRQIGGRMIVPGHGRQYYRLSDMDMYARDGLSPEWPFPQGELTSWYEQAERDLVLSGREEHSPWTPDSAITHEISPTHSEQALIDAVEGSWPSAKAILGRFAAPLNALEIAATTSKLACLQGAIVKSVRVDEAGNAKGVSFVDHASGKTIELGSSLVFLCASTLESTRILMMSERADGGEGLGANSGALGANLMDHIVMSAQGVGGPLKGGRQALQPGRSVFLPRFDLRNETDDAAQRGFGVQLYQSSLGESASFFQGVSFSEMTPRADNRLELDKTRLDKWGVPTLKITCNPSSRELEMAEKQAEALREIAEILGVELTMINDRPSPPGMAIHECGSARMGDSSDISVLDPFAQCWDAKGLYVTDGAAFPSQGTQNPTLTIMAITARAVDHAIKAQGE